MFEAYFKKYLENFAKNPKPVWNYEAGVTLLGAKVMYEITGDELYYQRIVEHMDHYILPDGSIRYLNPDERNLDRINSGKVLFYLYERTGEERYKIALDTLMDLVHKHPRTSTGNFWHKDIYPYQIWLDGLYMGLPLYLEYETKYNDKKNYGDVFSQMVNVRKLMYNEEKQLYYHAYDEKKVMYWADPETGLSHNYWLRSIGWHLMALIDLHEICSQEVFEQHKAYADWFKEALRGVLKYQDPETKLFYQLVDLPDVPGNYTETSGTAMVAYSILKGVRLGVLQSEKYRHIGEEILEELLKQKLVEIDGEVHLKDICKVAGVGNYDGKRRDGSVEYYLSEPIVMDEVKGVGATALAYGELLKLQQQDKMQKGMRA